MVGSGVAGLVSALLALREGRVLLIARAGFARNVPARVDSVPAAAIAALIELGVDPRAFSDLRRHDSRLVSWSTDVPVALKSPDAVRVERGALEATLFARVLKNPRLTLVPAPRSRAGLNLLIAPHARRGAIVLDATGRASVLAAQRVTLPSPWYAWTRLWPAAANHPYDAAFRIAATPDGYCYRLGMRGCLTVGIVTFARGPSGRQAELLEGCRREFPWLFEGVPGGELGSTDRVHPAAVQWATHVGVLAVGDACLARDALSSQGLACSISQAHYAVAVESRAAATLYEARAREQRRNHLHSLGGMLSESRHAGVAPWLRYCAFVARELEAVSATPNPVIMLRSRRLSAAVPASPIGG